MILLKGELGALGEWWNMTLLVVDRTDQRDILKMTLLIVDPGVQGDFENDTFDLASLWPGTEMERTREMILLFWDRNGQGELGGITPLIRVPWVQGRSWKMKALIGDLKRQAGIGKMTLLFRNRGVH